jgi:photosystem II stability/assembly factor-like uncharacterized protein
MMALPVKRTVRWHDLRLVPLKGGFALLAATSEGLWRSTDLGLHWTESPMARHRGVAAYAITGESSALAARGAAGIFVSVDQGQHWLALEAPFDFTQVFDVALTPATSEAIFCATTAGLYRFFAGRWTRIPGPLGEGTVSAVLYHPSGRGELYAAQFGRVFRSSDAGLRWTPLPELPAPGLTIRSLWFSASLPDSLFALTTELGVLIGSRR